jgi:glycosyltransferase involved in cell wall biosynthesis
VPIDEVDALTDRLVRLLTNRNVARAMGEAGRRRARSLFTWPRVVERMLHVMTPLVRSEERPACSMAS